MESVNKGSKRKGQVVLVAGLILVVILAVGVAGVSTIGNMASGNVLTYDLSEPFVGAASAKVNIDPGDGNLTIDGQAKIGRQLVGGELQYLEKQGVPTVSVNTSTDQTAITLKAGDGAQPRLRLPWQACYGATEWQIHLNPALPSDILAHSDGGNVKLDLKGMFITQVTADTGGGNIDVVLPENAADLIVTAKTGAGNVTVEIGSSTTGSNTVNASSGAGNVTVLVPSKIAARIHTSKGMGKVIMDGRFLQIDDNTYQSPDYETAFNKVEITVESGAGNVSVTTE
jgi:hypothetical protein